jgi:adenine phosphoribosyltransferase
MADYLSLIRLNPQGPRNDVTPLFADHSALRSLAEDLLDPFGLADFDYIAGIDALGFVLGTAMAFVAHKGFVPIRKAGRLPGPSRSVCFTDYTGQEKALEMGENAFKPQAGLLLVDDWIETGAQAKAAVQLIESQGGIVVGICAIHIDDNASTKWLRNRYRCHAVS